MCLKMSSEKKPISPVSGGMRQILDQNSKLRAQLRDAETERAQQVSELEKSLEDLKDEHNTEIAKLRGEHEAEVARVKESMHELNDVRQNLLKTEAEVERLQKEGAELRAKLDGAKQNLQSYAKLIAEEKQTTIRLGQELAKSESERKTADEEIEALKERIASLKPAAVENAKLKGRIAILEKDLQKEIEAKEAKIAECEELKQAGTLQRCEKLEAENTAMRALVAQHEKTTATALKDKELAEQQAFESRSKLLDLYADGEAKDIFKDSLDEAHATIKSQAHLIEQLQKDLTQAQKDMEDLKNNVLYSSKRENLRDSLSALAKRRSIGDSDG